MHSCRSRPGQGEKRAVITFVALVSLKSTEAHRHVGLGHVAAEVAGLVAHVDPLPDVGAVHHLLLPNRIPEGTCMQYQATLLRALDAIQYSAAASLYTSI